MFMLKPLQSRNYALKYELLGPRSIAVGSSKTTVAQKGDQRLEIRKCDGLTDGLTYMGRCQRHLRV